MKIVAIALICISAAVLLNLYAVRPCECNRVKPAVEAQVVRAAEQQGTLRADDEAERALRSIDRVCSGGRPDLDALMDSGAALQVLSRYEQAEKRYQAALEIDRRPELYLQLGNVQLALGRRNEGEESLFRGGLFNPRVLDGVMDPLVRRRVYDRVVTAHARMRKCYDIDPRRLKIQLNEQFGAIGRKAFARQGPRVLDERVFAPASSSSVTVAERTRTAPSAATGWATRNDSASTVVTETVPYASSGSRNLLHVTTDGLGGVTRTWATLQSSPQAVVTIAWVFVVSGEVFLGSGNGDALQFDNSTATAGEWILVPGINHSSPANTTAIVAGPAGAEFYVGSVAVFPIPPDAAHD